MRTKGAQRRGTRKPWGGCGRSPTWGRTEDGRRTPQARRKAPGGRRGQGPGRDVPRALCAIDAKRHDPCVRDVFAAVVSYADGGAARPWWEFTPQRKAQEEENARGEGVR